MFGLKATNVVNNVTPGNTAILSLPCAPTYDSIVLKLKGGLLKSHIKEIRGIIGGAIFYQKTGLEVDMFEKYLRNETQPDLLVLDFTQKRARNGQAEQFTSSLPSGLFTKLTFEIDIDGAAPATMRLEALTESRTSTTNPYILRVHSNYENFAYAGEHDMQIPAAMKGNVLQVFFHESTPNMIDRVEVWNDNAVLHNMERSDIELLQKRNDKTPQPSVFVLDFVADGNLSGSLVTMDKTNDAKQVIPTSYHLKVFTNAAGTCKINYHVVKHFANA
jgi:Viral coat protein P2 N-terminal domain